MLRRLLASVCGLAAVLLASPGMLLAKQAPDHSAVAIIAPGEVDASTTYPDRRVNERTGQAIALYHESYAVPLGTPEAMARQYLRDRAALLGLDDLELADLRHHATREAPQATVVRFRQHVGDVPVYGAEVTVTLHGDRVVFVMNTYEPGITVDTTPSLTKAAAREIAWRHVGVDGPVSFDGTTLVVYAKRGEERLVYRTVVVPSVSPIGEWEVLVDAHSGEIVKAVDRSPHVDGTGNVFDADPLSSAGAQYNDPGFTDGADADTPQLDGELQSKPLLDITFNGLTHELDGPYASIVDVESPFRGLFEQPSDTYAYTRTQDAFEAANTYFFIDTYMRYINETLGVPLTPFQYSGGVHFDPHGFNGADNSHYLGSTGTVTFGEGGVDDAEDSDVVVHELGHGIHDWLTSGGLSQVNGLSEGFGDFCAASYSRSLGQWSETDPEYYWVFNWDGHNPFWPGRRTNYPNTYPGGLVGQVHSDGQIWSTCLMAIWDEIGREAIDKAVFVGLSMTNGGTNQQDAANAVVQAALNMSYTDEQIAAMVARFTATGYMINVIGVDDAAGAPSAIRLLGASPNPFNPLTRISFEMPAAGHVRLDVFNASGQHVDRLVDGARAGGVHQVAFDAAGLGSGVYFYRLSAGSFNDVRKMTLLK